MGEIGALRLKLNFCRLKRRRIFAAGRPDQAELSEDRVDIEMGCVLFGLEYCLHINGPVIDQRHGERSEKFIGAVRVQCHLEERAIPISKTLQKTGDREGCAPNLAG